MRRSKIIKECENEIQAISDANGGRFTVEQVCDWALAHPESAINRFLLQHDDAKAAREFRLSQIRSFLGN
jgi:hypothetical protein